MTNTTQSSLDNIGHASLGDMESFQQFFTEQKVKRDRCLRKADQVYGKKTSAYKSGAVVRCRQGKIWKKK